VTQLAPLRRFVACLDGRRIPLNSEERSRLSGDIPYWGANGVVGRVGDWLFDEELVLLGEDGAPFDDPNRDVAFLVNEKVWVNNHIHVLRPLAGTDGRFLTYTLNSIDWMRHVGGSTRLKLTQDDMLAVKLPNIPLADQRTIADYLDAETARIDALIAKKQQLIHLLEERIAALVDAYFAPREAESTVRLARLATVQTGVTLNAAKVTDGPTVRMPYLRVANVQPGWLDLSEVKMVEVEPAAAARSRLRAGDVLMTEGGDIDKLGRGTVWRGEIDTCLHQNHVFAVRPRPGQLDSEFLANVTRTSHARAYFESTGVQSTNLASTNSFKVADFRIPALNIEDQRARCESYERSAEPLAESSATLKRQLILLAEHRQALITAAVTGEFVVSGAA